MAQVNDYVPGGGVVSPCREIFYLKIPKNASTFITNLLTYNGWEEWNLFDDPIPIQKTIIILRDPLDRWISGIATYIALNILGYGYGSDHFVVDYNDLVERIIFDQIIFDDHTDFQVKYVQQFNEVDKIFFRLNIDTISLINSFLGKDLNTNKDIEKNSSEGNYDTAQISQLIRNVINNKPDLKSKIILAYNKDYEYIKNINFYNEPR